MGYCRPECSRREARFRLGKINDEPDCAPTVADALWSIRPDPSAASFQGDHAVHLAALRRWEAILLASRRTALCSWTGQQESAAISYADSDPRKQNATAGHSPLSYCFFTMFFPKLNFVPTVTRTLLRPPSRIFEK